MLPIFYKPLGHLFIEVNSYNSTEMIVNWGFLSFSKREQIMARVRGSDVSGKSFAKTTIREVWNKGKVIPGQNPDTLRNDICGASIKFEDYGNTNSPHGWEVDHIKPVAHQGNDNLSNLQPLQWENNRRKSDSYPWNCANR